MTRYPSAQLHEEVAYIAYHFHWPYDQIMRMEHRDRQRWVAEIGQLNRRLQEAARAGSTDLWR